LSVVENDETISFILPIRMSPQKQWHHYHSDTPSFTAFNYMSNYYARRNNKSVKEGTD